MNTKDAVELSLGTLRGSQHIGHQAYLGIPYAQPPVGERRFRAPEPCFAWQGVRAATEFAASCPQGHHPIPGMAASGPRDEDCLFLNVFTPKADSAKRPVLFWIHGGGFRLGSGSEWLYHGGPLAERGDVVVVTIHYRLASLGYACFGEAGRSWGASANLGQLDQIEALRWVREHIDHFGGDPGNITIFGESAGSAAIGTLLAMPSARGLFHKAIMQSGVGRASSFDAASEFGSALLKELGTVCDDHQAIMGLAVDDIVAATNRVTAASSFMLGPVVDTDTLLEPPMQANAQGASADVPLLMGTNRDEQKLFNVVPDRPATADAELVSGVEQLLASGADGGAGAVIECFRRSRAKHGLPRDNNDLLDAIQSVVRFREPAARFAAEHAEHQGNTYQYLFCHESPARRGAFGACHALEMPFVFGTLKAPTQDRFAGTGGAVERLSGQMMDAWTAFARHGNPSHGGLGDWPEYDAATRATMILDATCEVAEDPFREERTAVAVADGR